MDYLDYYFKRFDLDIEKAYKKRLVPTDNGLRTAQKEMIGDAIIKKHKLFDELFPENIGYKQVTNKKLQKAGADYEVYFENDKTLYIDLKSCVGPNYNMKPEDYDTLVMPEGQDKQKGAPLEIYQKGDFTNTKAKLTDYFLYTFCDNTGIHYTLVNFDIARQVCLDHKDEYIIENGVGHKKQHYPYIRHTSGNGTGLYLKWPVVTKQVERMINYNI